MAGADRSSRNETERKEKKFLISRFPRASLAPREGEVLCNVPFEYLNNILEV